VQLEGGEGLAGYFTPHELHSQPAKRDAVQLWGRVEYVAPHESHAQWSKTCAEQLEGGEAVAGYLVPQELHFHPANSVAVQLETREE